MMCDEMQEKIEDFLLHFITHHGKQDYACWRIMGDQFNMAMQNQEISLCWPSLQAFVRSDRCKNI